MSLEASIAELNANFKTLIGILSAGNTPIAQPIKSTPAPEKTVEKTAPVAAPAPAETQEPVGTLDYMKDVQPVVLKLSSTKGRDAAIAVLTKLGLKSAKDAKPEQYQELINECQEALK